MDMTSIQQFLGTTATERAINIVAAIAFWVIGRWMIGPVIRRVIGRMIGLIQAGMNLSHVDPTLTKYLGSIVSIGAAWSGWRNWPAAWSRWRPSSASRLQWAASPTSTSAPTRWKSTRWTSTRWTSTGSAR